MLKRFAFFRFWPFHRHQFIECYGGIYSDVPGGPRSVHEIWWECDCGKVIDNEARERAKQQDTPNG